MNWKVFWGTVGKFYSIGYGIIFAFIMTVAALGISPGSINLGGGDIIFALWAFGTALWKANT